MFWPLINCLTGRERTDQNISKSSSKIFLLCLFSGPGGVRHSNIYCGPLRPTIIPIMRTSIKLYKHEMYVVFILY